MTESRLPNSESNQHESAPWSAGQTLALAAAIAALLPLVNMVVAMVMAGYGAAVDTAFDQQRFFQQLRQNGGYLTFASIAANGATIWAVLKFIEMRKSANWPTYLALRFPASSAWLTAITGLILFVVMSQVIGSVFQRPLYPDFLQQIYSTATPLMLFWVAVALLAPVAEEIYFRGFIYIGLRNSSLGASGAILVTAAIWSGIHLQYDLYDKIEIFLLGIFLGWLRFRYNSLLLPIGMHALVNLIALVGLASAAT